MRCKYIEQNRKEHLCSDYYISHFKNGSIVRCRLFEWEDKRGVCPYDEKIFSVKKKIRKDLKDKVQKTLSGC